VDRRTVDLEVRLKRKPGTSGLQNEVIGSVISYGEVTATGRYAHDGTQEFKGTVGIIRDMTFRRKSEEMLRKLYQAIDQLGVCIFMLNHAFEVEYVNPAFFMLTGFEPPDVIGKSVFRFFALLPDTVTSLVRTVQDGFEVRQEALVPRSAGGEFRVELLVTPVRSPSGAITHSIIIAEDVSCRRSIEEQLENVRSEAKQLNEEKNLLLSGISREMEHPVRSIVSTIRSILASQKQYGDSLDGVLDHAQGLLGALEIIQDYGLEIKGDHPLLWASFRFKEFIEHEFDECRAKAERTGLGFSLAVDTEETVHSEPERLGRVLGLVSDELLRRTAIGTIAVDASVEWQEGNVPYMMVRVSGEGTINGSLELNGSIGLALARNFAKTLGGEIRIEQGRKDFIGIAVMIPAAQPVKNNVSSASRYTVLIVDDNEVNLEFTHTLMENYGYRVHCATNASEALSLLETHFVDVALLDIRMPGTDGTELAHMIRDYTGSKFSSKMPLFAMTAHGHHEVLEQDKLFLSVFSKPADILRLSSSIVEAMRDREKTPEDLPLISSLDTIRLDAYSALSELSRALMENSEDRVDVKVQLDVLASKFKKLGYDYGQELIHLFGQHYANEDKTVLSGLADRLARMFSDCFTMASGQEVRSS
jgi:PAS domain S-box-containing protein